MAGEQMMMDDGLEVELVGNYPEPPVPKQPTENRWLEAFSAIDDERTEGILYCQAQTKYVFECMQRLMKIRNAYLACLLIGSAICVGGLGYHFYRIYDNTLIVRSCNQSEWSEWKVVSSEYKRTICSLAEYIPAKCPTCVVGTTLKQSLNESKGDPLKTLDSLKCYKKPVYINSADEE